MRRVGGGRGGEREELERERGGEELEKRERERST